jgi:Holliday junction resolvasome RuvABC endonuclease subunit
MIVLGLDPGSTVSNPTGFAFYDSAADAVICYGLLKPTGTNPIAHLGSIASQLDTLLRDRDRACLVAHATPLTLVAIEAPWTGQHAQAGLILARLVGALTAVALWHKLDVCEVSPATAKAAVATGNAQKAQVQQAILWRYGLTAPSHVCDAVAVAVAASVRDVT